MRLHSSSFFFSNQYLSIYQVTQISISISLVTQSCPTLCGPMDCSKPSFPVHSQLPELAQIMSIELVMPSNNLNFCCPLLLLPSIFPSICLFQCPGKNTGVGCHFLLQGVFLTQESNPGLLHCRQVLYQLSYNGRPSSTWTSSKSITEEGNTVSHIPGPWIRTHCNTIPR